MDQRRTFHSPKQAQSWMGLLVSEKEQSAECDEDFFMLLRCSLTTSLTIFVSKDNIKEKVTVTNTSSGAKG